MIPNIKAIFNQASPQKSIKLKSIPVSVKKPMLVYQESRHFSGITWFNITTRLMPTWIMPLAHSEQVGNPYTYNVVPSSDVPLYVAL